VWPLGPTSTRRAWQIRRHRVSGEPRRGPDGTRGAATVRGATVEPGGMMDPDTTNTQRARGRLAEDRSQILGCSLAQIVSVAEREDTMAPEANNAERARECARVKRWQRAEGLCRCGARIVAESRSR